MAEWQLFEPGTIPVYATTEWYADRESAPHLSQEGHRQRIELSASEAAAHVPPGRFVVDVGSGDGGLLWLLRDQYDIRGIGYDLQQTNVAAARDRAVDVRYGDAYDLRIVDGWHEDQCVAALIATEIVEHMVDPRAFLRHLHSMNVPLLVASSPYTETPEAHYDFHLWAWDFAGYAELMESCGWHVISQKTAWISQNVVCVRTAGA